MEGERRRGTVEALIQSAIAVHQCAGELDFLALLVADVTGAIVELHQHTPVIEAFVDHLETVCKQQRPYTIRTARRNARGPTRLRPFLNPFLPALFLLWQNFV